MTNRSSAAPLVVALVAAACVPDQATPPMTKSPDLAPDARAAIVDAGGALAKVEDAGPKRQPILEGPPKWKSVPRADNGFYAVLDGLCSDMGISRVGTGVVIHYGGAHNEMYLDGKRRGAASFIALREDGLESIGDPVISSPTGVAGSSIDDFWIADSTGTRSSEGATLYRWSGGKWKTYQKDQTNLHAWVDGGIIGSLGMAAANGDVWVEGSTTKPPESFYRDMPFPRLAAFPTGDVLIAARKGDMGSSGPLVARHWAPGKKVRELPLEGVYPGADKYAPWFKEIAPDEIYGVREDRVGRWDGSAFRLLAKTPAGEELESDVARLAPDDLWVLTKSQKILHVTAQGMTPIATPEKVADYTRAGDEAWMVGVSGKLYRRAGEEWKPVTLPGPAFSAGATTKAKRVLAAAEGDVLVILKYWEKAPGWKEQELHTALFRTKPVKETLRCNEPDPENNNVDLGHGFQSWPPMATAECKTPFVVLARRSNARKVVDDWPRLRTALKGQTEALVEIVSGDRTFVGTKAKDLESAKAIVQAAVKADRLRPEIVCGDPEAKRTIPVEPK